MVIIVTDIKYLTAIAFCFSKTSGEWCAENTACQNSSFFEVSKAGHPKSLAPLKILATP